MPFPIRNLLEDNPPPLTICPDEPATKALALMIEHDYSQLPVVDSENQLLGIVTMDSILRAVQTFQLMPDKFAVRDCQTKASFFQDDAELFDVLGELQDNPAVVIVGQDRKVVGIVTDFDAAAYFRRRAEGAMLVEDIENTLRSYIQLAFPNTKERSESFASALTSAIAPDRDRERFRGAVCAYLSAAKGSLPPDEDALTKGFAVLSKDVQQAKGFDDLTFAEYTRMFLSSERWRKYEGVIKLERAAIQKMLDEVRDIRNKIAHFRGDVTKHEHAKLIQCRDWLQAYQADLLAAFGETEEKIAEQVAGQETEIEKLVKEMSAQKETTNLVEETVTARAGGGSAVGESKYRVLGRWLGSVPDKISTTWIYFDKIENLLGQPLPDSAYRLRSWWANDWTSHSQSRAWLEAGWETDIIDLEKLRIRFRRANSLEGR